MILDGYGFATDEFGIVIPPLFAKLVPVLIVGLLTCCVTLPLLILNWPGAPL
jgi:hypothetical protein